MNTYAVGLWLLYIFYSLSAGTNVRCQNLTPTYVIFWHLISHYLIARDLIGLQFFSIITALPTDFFPLSFFLQSSRQWYIYLLCINVSMIQHSNLLRPRLYPKKANNNSWLIHSSQRPGYKTEINSCFVAL